MVMGLHRIPLRYGNGDNVMEWEYITSPVLHGIMQCPMNNEHNLLTVN